MRQTPTPAVISFEPEVTHQFLPGCRAELKDGTVCGSPHPLAVKPIPADTTVCHVCGSKVAQPGAPVVERVAITGNGPVVLAARAMLKIGETLNKFAGRK